MIEKFYIRSSQLGKIMTGNFGLSEAEHKKFDEYTKRELGLWVDKKGKPMSLTEKMKQELEKLEEKYANPKLNSGSISYLREIVYEHYYELKKEVYSPALNHGNWNEQLSISMLNNLLEIGLEKNEEKFFNDEYLLSGTPDVLTDDFVLDIKNPIDFQTFNSKRSQTESLYLWQLQAYMFLTGRKEAFLVYTLNPNQYMEGNEYDHLTKIDRIICKRFQYEEAMIEKYVERIPAIKKAVAEIEEELRSSFDETLDLLLKVKELSPVQLLDQYQF